MNTIEEIESEFWGPAPADSSYLMRTVYELRKKDIGEFDIGDLRVMIGQDEALTILIPMALEKLRENFYVEGDYYEGDLLKSVLTSSREFWDENPNLRSEVLRLYNENISRIHEIELTNEIRERIFEAYENFKAESI